MMNKDEISGNWKQLKGKAKEQWGKLTDDDMTVIEGKRDQLVGKIQERYGYAKDQAEKEVSDWERKNDYALVANAVLTPCLCLSNGIVICRTLPAACRPTQRVFFLIWMV